MLSTPSATAPTANETALASLKTQEQPILAAMPPKANVAQPSNILQKYIDTGDSIFKEAAGHAMEFLQHPVKSLGDVFSNTVYANTDSVDAHRQALLQGTLAGIAGNESGGVKGNKYLAVNKNPDGTRDLGKYQVNETTLKNLSNKYLGQQFTPAQFLASPNLQDMFAAHRIDNWIGQGYDKDHMASMWHHGASSELEANDPYVKKFDSIFADTQQP